MSIADDGYFNIRPSIDGDLVAFESAAGGDLDVMVHDLSTGDTHVVSTDPSNQTLNHIYRKLLRGKTLYPIDSVPAVRRFGRARHDGGGGMIEETL